MTSFFIRQAEPTCKELIDAGLADVINCPVCHGFTRRNLIQVHELIETCRTCPGCYFLQGVFVVLARAGYDIPLSPWTPLYLTSWTLWGKEHFVTIARCERRRVEHWDVPTILEEADFIEVFKLPGTPCPWRKIPTAKMITGDTGSPACIGLLRSRLQHCIQNHESCRDTSNVPLPTRVLQISIEEGVHVVVRLTETHGKTGKYLCLSHRWIGGQTITTTSSNIEGRLTGIPWKELPKTFSEAIVVALNLGFEYIWIDSLCINQDISSGDWLIEAPKMAQYYQNATLTISAAEAKEGLFHSLPDSAQMHWRVEPPEHFNQPGYDIYIRRPLPHGPSALHSRGWVFQEHLLSPRVAHYRKELIWECAELTACECGRFPLPMKEGQYPLKDAWDIGNVAGTYGRKKGHLLSMLPNRSGIRYSIIPQPVFIRPMDGDKRNGLEISHWLLTQKQMGTGSDYNVKTMDTPKKAPDAVYGDSQFEDDMDDLSGRVVLLQTGGVHHERKKFQETPPSLPATEDAATNAESRIKGNQPPSDKTTPEKEIINVSPPTPLLHSRWLDIVAHYTRLSLTFSSDTFPALAGLAKQLQPCFGGEYYAGAWEHTFAMDLLWRTRNPKNHSKSKEWRAPSWSWASTSAAVDYYHLMMAFELDTQTFRYSISESFIGDVTVECEPLEGDDMTMQLKSAEVTLEGFVFAVYLSTASVDDVDDEQQSKTSQKDKTEWTEEQIESMRPTMEQAIQLPKITIPEHDIRYFPLQRCMDGSQEIAYLVHDTGMSFVSGKDKEREIRNVLDVWWDYGQDCKGQYEKRANGGSGSGKAEEGEEKGSSQSEEVELAKSEEKDGAAEQEEKTGKTEAKEEEYEMYACLLVARHESTMDTAYFSLILKQVDEHGTYERVGLLRHEDMPQVQGPVAITIV